MKLTAALIVTSVYLWFHLTYQSILAALGIFFVSNVVGLLKWELTFTRPRIIFSILIHLAILGGILYLSELINIIGILVFILWYGSALGISLSQGNHSENVKS